MASSESSTMQERVLLVAPIHIKEDNVPHSTIDTSAIALAMTAQCSESEESSDDSCSSDGSFEEESIGGSPTSSPEMDGPDAMSAFAPRRPTALSMSPMNNRRASSPSQRSLNAPSSSIRSVSICIPSSTSRRAPSISMRHDAALRALQQRQNTIQGKPMPKSKPSVVDLTAIPKNALPCIEIEQVFEDGKASAEMTAEAELAKKDLREAKAKNRSAARKRMLNTLGRGQSKATPTSALTTSQDSNHLLKNNLPAQPSTEMQDLKSPGTASYFAHQRIKSSPSPTSPFNELLGSVNVFVTPPTPQPQESCSPILGVSFSGTHRNAANDVFEPNRFRASSLAPPPFELAPGKQRMAREQNEKALAWVASMQLQQQQMQVLYQQQQQLLLSSMQHQQLPFGSFDARAFGIFDSGAIQSPTDSSWNLPTTTRAPSMAYMQQQKAIKAQQQMMNQYSIPSIDSVGLSRKSSLRNSRTTTAAVASSAAISQTSKSWWRRAQSDLDGSKSADEALHWRKRDSDQTESLVGVRSAKPVYLPPGKRAVYGTQREVLRGRA